MNRPLTTLLDFILHTLTANPDTEYRVADLAELGGNKWGHDDIAGVLQLLLKNAHVVQTDDGNETWWATGSHAPAATTVDAALDAMDADALRTFVRQSLAELDEKTRNQLTGRLVDQAARTSANWAPRGPSDDEVQAILAFAKRAQRRGHADPAEVDEGLRSGSEAFLARRYDAAIAIFRALLVPIGDGDLDLGQDELVEEVLGVDPADCATQYVVSVYMTTCAAERAAGVHDAIAEMSTMGNFSNLLKDLEHAAV
jgi:hypothetical protein